MLAAYGLDALRARGWLSRRSMWLIAAPAIVACLVGLAMYRHVDADEAEHVHTAWLMSVGQRPFADFFCHHSPLLGCALRPLVAALPDSVVVLDAVRVVAALLTALAGAIAVAISRRLWGSELDLWTVGLVASGVAWLEMSSIRPDIPAAVLAMCSVLVLAIARVRWHAVAAGALLGLSLCFSPKHLTLLALGPVLALWTRGQERPDWTDAALFVAGAAAPVALMGGWLAHQGLFPAAWEWLVVFNREVQFSAGPQRFSVYPALLVAVLAITLWIRLGPAGRARIGPVERTVVTAAVLAALAASIRVFAFDRQLTVLLAAGLVARPARFGWLYLRGCSALLAALAVALALAGFAQPVTRGLVERDYLLGRGEIAALIAVADGDTVVCRTEHHPLVAADATHLWQEWQWRFWMDRPRVQAELRDFVPTVIARRPAVFFDYEPGVPPLLAVLTTTGTVGPDDARRLQRFLEANYDRVALRHTGNLPVWFWVRADLTHRLPADAVVEVVPRATGDG